mgnify:CR=1 FL=1
MLSRLQLESIGFAELGHNVQISERASFYGVNKICIGSNVRIDDFCVFAAGVGGIHIKNYVHIAVGASLIGAGSITLEDFSGLSSRVSVYSSSDDYSGHVLTNPTVPDIYKNVLHADVYIGRHVIVGSGSVILPGVSLEEGVAIGALSLVRKNCEAFGIYAGNPARKIKERNRELLEMEKQFLATKAG